MHKLTLKKMLYLFMVISCILVFGVDLYAGAIYCRDMNSREILYTTQNLEEMTRQIELRMNVIAQNLTQLSEKNSILDFISMNNLRRLDTAPYIDSLLDSYAETEPSMMMLFFHITEGTILRGDTNTTESENYRLLRAYYELVQRQQLNCAYRTPRYARVYDAGETSFKSESYLLAIMVPIFDMDYCGSLIALVDISQLIDNVIDTSQPMLLLFDGAPMWSSDKQLYETAMESPLSNVVNLGEMVMDVYSAQPQSLQWELCLLKERTGPYSRMGSHLWNNMPLVICVLIIEGVLLVFIYYWIVRQVERLALQMERIGIEGDEGLQKISIPLRSSNEIVVLARGINGMLRRVDTLNQQINQAKIDYLDQHILFLQLQINPHFLFNALSSMRGMAVRQSWENVSDMIDNMASIYRYCMDGDTMSEISKEIECIQWYARTFEIRYREGVKVQCETEPDVEHCEVPRMMLQPLIENAFLHSFARRGYRSGLLRIVSRAEGDWLVIEMENDGLELDDAVLAQMNGSTSIHQKYSGIGIVNVRRRIELLGGEGASLVYRRRSGGGAIATIRFPLRRVV